jgi:ribosome-interacting GTPase 1
MMPSESSGGGGGGFDVAKAGDGRVALIGFPSVGKSSLLNAVTDTKSEAAAYEFTTLTCIPGNLVINDTKIQMLDLPGIIEGAAGGILRKMLKKNILIRNLPALFIYLSVYFIIGRGRGREVIAVARSADLILMVLDGARESNNQHRNILERELETMGIRLNKRPPDIYYRVITSIILILLLLVFLLSQTCVYFIRKKRAEELNSMPLYRSQKSAITLRTPSQEFSINTKFTTQKFYFVMTAQLMN